MKVEIHKQKLEESKEVIDEILLKQNLEKRQTTLGFHASNAAMHILEIILHKNDLVSSGFQLNHKWFKSKRKIAEKLPFNFKNKDKILDIIHEIELKRDQFCYGVPKSEEDIILLIKKFQNLLSVVGDEIE